MKPSWHYPDGIRRKYTVCGRWMRGLCIAMEQPRVTCRRCRKRMGLEWPQGKCEWVVPGKLGLEVCGATHCMIHPQNWMKNETHT